MQYQLSGEAVEPATGSPLGFESSAREELERVKRDAGEGGGSF